MSFRFHYYDTYFIMLPNFIPPKCVYFMCRAGREPYGIVLIELSAISPLSLTNPNK